MGVAEVAFSDVIKFGDEGLIKNLRIDADTIEGEFYQTREIQDKKARKFKTSWIFYEGFVNKALGWKLEKMEAEASSSSDLLLNMMGWLFPVILLIVLWVFIMRQMQAGGNKAMMFGKSRAKMLSASQKKVTFKDVAGCEEAKEELEEIIEFLKEPQKFQRLGGKIPKGVLLMGSPGTGKTLLARAVAGEANVPFFSISGSDFVEMFVGVGASRVRDLFEQGKKNAPCIIFIDEIDAVGRHRGAGMGGGHDEREQTLNQLLVEMDGFESNDGVILVAATNRPDVLDPAILRPGRFDRRVVVDLPDVKGREAILKVHTRKVPIAQDVNFSVIARGTPGFSGADLANMVNEAALLAARHSKRMVHMLDLEEAKDKILMGPERRSMVLSEKEKYNTAIHEAGHTLVAALIGDTDPVHKVTIIPRGRALGVTMQLPLDDRHSYTATYLKNRLAILMGGRIAEEVFLDQTTSGAKNDIEMATKMARQMVCEMGMSEKVGPIAIDSGSDQPFLGRDFYHPKNISEATAKLVDDEIRELIENNYQRAETLILENKDTIKEMADKLLEVETLEQFQINQIINGEEMTLTNPDIAKQAEVVDVTFEPPVKERLEEKTLSDNPSDEAD
ncbi:MAG: cell division protein FtsH [Acidobacteria bacterium]|nr:MAG: cell division protein FtsH [Acidobacteriota bacterium]PIE90663.1 MAG: cell division protein FtsH [Acidobacteriota bacterium]